MLNLSFSEWLRGSQIETLALRMEGDWIDCNFYVAICVCVPEVG